MTAVEKARALASELGRRAQQDWEHGLLPDNIADLRASGLPSLTVPRVFGGGGEGITTASRVVTEVARGDASTALILAMHYIHTASLFQPTELSPVVRTLAEDLVRTHALISVTASEQRSGPPSRGGRIDSTAVRQPDGRWLLNGRKTYATGSAVLDYAVAVVNIVDDSGVSGLGGTQGRILVPLRGAGISIHHTWDTLGLRGSASDDVEFQDVLLPGDAVLGGYERPGPGSAHSLWWPLLLASMHLGIGEAARDDAFAFTSGPRNDGTEGILADTDRVRDRAARIELELIPARAVLADATRRVDENDPSFAPALASSVKLLVHGYSSAAVDHAGRLIGAASLQRSSPFQRYYRDIRAALHNPPADDTVRDALGTHLLTQPDSIDDHRKIRHAS
ncbi:acyl-CoA dehydrogenase family protein [Rhodococcoides yunnanense]|uniref:acyl-CoA dehydrogenase family protein n=1 Tax=Rhodococcoides yunnanense TaxID=278209 RepID=UPI0009348666|nr:acyl-CoA dehydrogenase family protein [Rhodococcus yunnanensis]